MEGCLKFYGYLLLVAFGIGVLILIGGAIMTGIESCNNKIDKDEETTWMKSYNEAIEEKDFEKAHNILKDIYTEYKVGDRSAEFTLDAYSEVYGAEFRYLILSGDETAKDKISYMFTEIPVIGKKLNTGTVYGKYWGERFDRTLYNEDFDNYLKYTNCINGLCNLVLDLAIQNDKYELATLAIDHYVESVCFKKTLKKGETKDDDQFLTKIYYKAKDKEAAQTKLNKAIKEGKIEKSE